MVWADSANDRVYDTMCRPSVVCLSVVCLYRHVLWLNSTSYGVGDGTVG